MWCEARPVNLLVTPPVSSIKKDTRICFCGEYRTFSFSPSSVLPCSSQTPQSITTTKKISTNVKLSIKKKEARCAAHCPVLVFLHTYLLFSPLLPLVLCVLQHLLPPKVKEVGWIGVELQTLLPIVPADVEMKPWSLGKCWYLEEFGRLASDVLLCLTVHYSLKNYSNNHLIIITVAAERGTTPSCFQIWTTVKDGESGRCLFSSPVSCPWPVEVCFPSWNHFTDSSNIFHQLHPLLLSLTL